MSGTKFVISCVTIETIMNGKVCRDHKAFQFLILLVGGSEENIATIILIVLMFNLHKVGTRRYIKYLNDIEFVIEHKMCYYCSHCQRIMNIV